MKSLEELRAIREKMQGKVASAQRAKTRSEWWSAWLPAESQAAQDQC